VQARPLSRVICRVKNKTTDDTWFLRFYQDVDGKRVYRKHKIDTVRELPRRADAEKAVLALRAKINSQLRVPETVSELITHYKKHELTTERKAFATVEAHRNYIDRYIQPAWGHCKLSEVRTVAVEQWLESLSLAPGSKSKIRNVMSAIYSHGIRNEWIAFNPLSKVRCSAKRLREPDVVTPEEFQALLGELQLRERTMVMLIGSTGLRRSELIALRWCDVNLNTMEISVTRSCVRRELRKHRKIHFTRHKNIVVFRAWLSHERVPQSGVAGTYKEYRRVSSFLKPCFRISTSRSRTSGAILSTSRAS
jgi:integrase